MTTEKINKILQSHQMLLNGEVGGERADLSGASLRYADLRDADLRGANLNYANLSCANLSSAKLYDANLRDANLSCANLSSASLRYANLRDANLSCANLSSAKLYDANLRDANLYDADLSDANLSDANLCGANLCGANLSGANLSGANLRCANLSGATKGLLSPTDYLAESFERVDAGYIVYKTFGSQYEPPARWKIEPHAVLDEVVNFDRCTECGSGINVAPLEWVRGHYKGDIWKVLIRGEWLAGVCVPYMTDGKIRCERVELLEIVERRTQ